MDSVAQRADDRLAQRLSALRAEKGLSLQELAERSGISRATLSRIENGDVSPTAETLGALASAYAMTISRLLAPAERPFAPLIAREQQSVWHDPPHGFTRHIVSPPSGVLTVEVIRCEIAAGHSISYEKPPVIGQEHHLIMLSGALTVSVEGETRRLKPGDCLRYRLFGASCFKTGRAAASYLMVLA